MEEYEYGNNKFYYDVSVGDVSKNSFISLNGYGSDKIITEYEDNKSIGNSTTLKEDTASF